MIITATISSTMRLNDSISGTMRSITTAMRSTLTAMRSIQGVQLGPEFARAAADMTVAERSLERLDAEMLRFGRDANSATRSAGEGFTVMKGIAVQAITAIANAGKEMLGDFVAFGDTMINNAARLSLIAQGSETVAGLQEQIYQAAQRSRGSYEGMADSVSKLGAQARDAFSSNDQIIAFSELLNKTFVTAGTNASGVQSVMYNLTQALGSGVLRGQDLNAVMSNTPQILQYIADYMEVPMGEIRAMAADGELSASVIKNAMFAAADDINAKFETMPQTFEQTTTMMKNSMMFAFSEMGIGFSQFLSEKLQAGFQWLIDNFDTVANVAAIAGSVLIGVGVGVAVAWGLAHLPIVAIIAGIVLLGVMLAEFGFTADQILGFVGGLFGWLYGVIYNIVAEIYNVFISFAEFFANFLNDPIGSIQRLFWNLADFVLGILQTIASGIDAVFGSDLADAVQGWRQGLSSRVEEVWGAPSVTLERMEQISVGDAMRSGSSLLSGAANSLVEGVDKLKETMASGVGGAGVDLSDVMINAAGGKALKTKDISDEEIKLLTDIATRDYQLQYQQLAPSVSVNWYGDNRTGQTADEIVDQIAYSLEEITDAYTGATVNYG